MKKIYLLTLFALSLAACKKEKIAINAETTKIETSNLKSNIQSSNNTVDTDTTKSSNPGDFIDPTRPIFGGGVGSN